MSASAIYFGSVRHRRYAERERAFSHGLAMAYVDLDELPRLGRLSARGPGLVRFRRSDYFGEGPLDVAVRDRVEADTGFRPDGPVRVLTHLRSFGHCFNPVSFYYCFDRDDRLQALLAEVTNTPWGERQSYTLTRGDRVGAVLKGQSEKLMHVSPFFGMDQRYEWSVAEPGETLSLHIQNREGTQLAFDATLTLERRPFTRRWLARMTARYPFATLRILALIYAHAVVIRMRGIHTRPHPARASA